MATPAKKRKTTRTVRRVSKSAGRQRHAHGSKQAAARQGGRRWSAHVMATSDALDLEHDIFKTGSAEEIAQSLKRSATKSRRRKGSPFQSAMSMLNFYVNRGGRNLSAARKKVLNDAKIHLRKAFGRDT
jgi:hypothetical protein